jgi:hypothetical protein
MIKHVIVRGALTLARAHPNLMCNAFSSWKFLTFSSTEPVSGLRRAERALPVYIRCQLYVIYISVPRVTLGFTYHVTNADWCMVFS